MAEKAQKTAIAVRMPGNVYDVWYSDRGNGIDRRLTLNQVEAIPKEGYTVTIKEWDRERVLKTE
jgi:hypothetical protein